MWKVLFVDDEPRDHAILNLTLPPFFELHSCYTGNEALVTYAEKKPQIVLLDIVLPDIDGIELLKLLRKEENGTVFIMVSGHDDPDMIVEAVKAGAEEYLVKPYTSDTLRRILQKYVQRDTNSHLHPSIDAEAPARFFQHVGEFGLVGRSSAIQNIQQQIKKYGPSDSTVLITGESGTGKELIARALHETSKRKEGPFLAVNCSTIPDSLFESELFGTERGAFTDATDRQGIFDSADTGTLFLDEIGELTPRVQVKLLRVLEDKEIRPIGSSRSKKIDIRIIAATNQDLLHATESGNFRRDLYYRLNVFRISIPPLRERKEDIPLLAYHFLHTQSEKSPLSSDLYFKEGALKKLLEHDWPGNIRELKHVIERAIHLTETADIGPELITFF
jgi:DNA-binding NtrC family response regulator